LKVRFYGALLAGGYNDLTPLKKNGFFSNFTGKMTTRETGGILCQTLRSSKLMHLMPIKHFFELKMCSRKEKEKNEDGVLSQDI
jgi:hypothetical protein